jgi:phenylacetate-CoA ligase
MLIVKGVNVYPAAIKDVIVTFVPDVTGELRIVLENPPPRIVPPLQLKIEHGEHIGKDDLPGLGHRIAMALHEAIKIRPEIAFVAPGSLPKETSRKTPVFEKNYQE